jgi:probable F420-dependent oxidoreductase
VKFGLAAANTIPFTDPGPARDLVVAAEEAGFESIWTVEHVVWPHRYHSTYPYTPDGRMPGNPSIPIPDPIVWLTWAAAYTTRVRLGTGVVILPQRNPVVFAKEVATLDHLSGGRVELGIGVGWLREEFEAIGVPFDRRGERTDDMLEAMTALWSSDDAVHQGEFVSFEGVSSNPKPVRGKVPIVVGGKSVAAARRAARFGDGFYTGPEDLAGLAETLRLVHAACEAIGRDPADLEYSAVYPGRFLADPDGAMAAMADLGIDRVMIPSYHLTRPSLEEGMAAFAAAVG